MKKYFFLAVLAFGVMTAQAQIGKLLDKAKKDAKALSGQGDDNTGLGLKEAFSGEKDTGKKKPAAKPKATPPAPCPL